MASEIVPVQPDRDITPMDMLRIALTQGADIDKLQQLMEFKERWEAAEARKEFDNAMAEFKSSVLKIAKNKTAKFETQRGVTEYQYATLDNVNDSVIPALSAVGINHRWRVEQTAAEISVTCVLKHRRGHSEETTLRALADQSGGKNAIQAIGSAVTYLERYTLLAATGLAVGGTDDDGNQSSPHPGALGQKSLPAAPSALVTPRTANGEPDIRPRSQKGAQPPTQAPPTAPEPNGEAGEAVQGQVVDAEPSITPGQGKRFFAIMRSANLSDAEVKKRLAAIGWHGHRDTIPKRLYEKAIDAIDPEMKFHVNQPKQ